MSGEGVKKIGDVRHRDMGGINSILNSFTQGDHRAKVSVEVFGQVLTRMIGMPSEACNVVCCFAQDGLPAERVIFQGRAV